VGEDAEAREWVAGLLIPLAVAEYLRLYTET